MYVFKEKQNFRKKFTFILLIAICLFSVYTAFNYAMEHVNDEINLLQFFTLLLPIGVAFLIGNMSLSTRIDDQGIQYRFFPFHLSYRKVRWSELEKCFIREYNPITEYGGWGYRISFSRKKGTAHSVNGNIGLQLEMKDGKKILLGTQKKAEMEQTIGKYFNKKRSSLEDN